MAPFDVMDAYGRMALVLDPAGAAVALWQANQHIGATLVNEPGTVIWNELVTTDPGAVAFYADVLGMTTSTEGYGRRGACTRCSWQAGRMVGGTTGAADAGRAQSLARVLRRRRRGRRRGQGRGTGRGGRRGEPFDIPVGRIVVISDPQGAVFSIMQYAPGPPSGRGPRWRYPNPVKTTSSSSGR